MPKWFSVGQEILNGVKKPKKKKIILALTKAWVSFLGGIQLLMVGHLAMVFSNLEKTYFSGEVTYLGTTKVSQ